MKKLILVLVSLIILASFPYIVGSKAETHFNDLLDKANENPGYSLKLVDYNKGWLSSTARVEFTFNMPDDTNITSQSTIIFVQKMFHGPLLWKTKGPGIGLIDSSVVIELPKEWQEELDKLESVNKDTLKFTSRTAFSGATHSYLELSAFSHTENALSLNINSATGSFSYDMSGHMLADFDWQGLRMSEQGKNTLEIAPVHLEVDQQLVKGELFAVDAIYTGSFSSSIEKFSFTSDNPLQKVALSGLNINASSELKQELMDLHAFFGVNEIQAMGKKLNKFVYDLSMLNIDATVLQEFARLIADAQGSMQAKPELVQSVMLENLIKLIPRLVSKNPVLKINNLGISSDDGTITSQLELVINQDLYEPNNLPSLIPALDVKASGKGPEVFFTAFGLSGMIEPLVQQKMLLREDKQLKFNFRFVNGAPTMNGQPIPMGGTQQFSVN